MADTLVNRAEALPQTALDRLFTGVSVLGDGATGTMLYDRGISLNRCYEELNLSQPAMIASIHTAYLEAGAEVIETNTFGANACRLGRHGLRGRTAEINRAGVRIARQCVGPTGAVCVAGSVGPLGVRPGELPLDDARAAFAEQIRALGEGGPGVGVDLLVIETMTSLTEAAEAIRAAREVARELRLVVMMTVDDQGNCLDGASAEVAATRLTELGADAIGCNCSTGPAAVLRAIERMRRATHLPLAAMPNAGLPRSVGGRSVYSITPEEMASFARKLIVAGAGFVGGCCGTTPKHTCAVGVAMRALRGQ
jgi:methionine synthase I (cobalamin-dependent)